MIILDLETSGLHCGKCGIWQIGALEFENPENYFLQEGRIDEKDEVTQEALELTEKTEQELRSPSKQTQKQLILNFLDWAKTCNERIPAGQNIGWDVSFIMNKCIDYEIRDKFRESIGQRTIDLHTVAQERYYVINKSYLLENNKSKMNLYSVLQFCGLPDERKQVLDGGKIGKEGKAHNALEDIKLEAECFSRLLHGKNLIKEFENFPIPEYLRK